MSMVVAVHVASTDANESQSHAQSTTAPALRATTNAAIPPARASASTAKNTQTWQSPAQGLWLLFAVRLSRGQFVVSCGAQTWWTASDYFALAMLQTAHSSADASASLT